MNHIEAHEQPQIYGLAARYSTREGLLSALKQITVAGYRRIETYSPFHIDGVVAIPGYTRTYVQWAVFVGGILGGLGGYMMQYVANVRAFPMNIGGRPFNSWPAFVPISFELTILCAAIIGFIAFLVGCRLPRLHHPLFNVPGFERATMDRFFLCIKADDAQFDGVRTRRFLEETKPDDLQTISL